MVGIFWLRIQLWAVDAILAQPAGAPVAEPWGAVPWATKQLAQGGLALTLPEAGRAGQHPPSGAALPRVTVHALRGHLAGREAAGGDPHLPEPGPVL